MGDSLWRGACHFAPLWVAFRGQAADNRVHAHAALQLCVSLGGSVRIRDADGRRFEAPALLVRPGARHRLEPSGDTLIWLAEPQASLAQRLWGAVAGGEVVEVPAETVAAQFTVGGPLANLCGQEAGRARRALDPRLARALAFLDAATLRNAVSRAATHCGLSTARLRAVAKSELGVPLSKWVAWQALRRAAVALRSGASLAEAAGVGGFADQAHFTRALGNTIGVTPATLRAALLAEA